ncbi:MAG: AbrB/MazE/SpoVT family DNA-binding domain-containing protein [Methanobacteriaceae archaeon]|nr:AbrB/MazE/SpoVT family DNA-binding domain-containing protein [Methanobacteriaceae archaeon]
MLATTKIYKNNQTVIPKEIRKKFNIDKNTIIEWDISKDGKPEINFRKKVSIDEMIGSIKLDYKTNAVELEKELYK